jgi:REP element-mobilizing transposase RayT
MKSMKYMKILDVFVVMPNHVHGIIIINKTNGVADTTSATGNTDVETQNFASLLRIIRKEHYLLNQSRNIHLISQSKKWDSSYYPEGIVYYSRWF